MTQSGSPRPNLASESGGLFPIQFQSAMAQAAIHDVYDTILILDFGSQVSSRLLSSDANIFVPTKIHFSVQPSDH